MKTRTPAAAVVAMLFCVTASAQQAPAPDAAMPGVEVKASTMRYYIPPQDIAAVAGTYQMSNGAPMQVRAWQSRLIVDFDQRRTELVPVGAQTYAARDGSMVLDTPADPAFGQVTLRYVPQAQLASAGGSGAMVTLVASE